MHKSLLLAIEFTSVEIAAIILVCALALALVVAVIVLVHFLKTRSAETKQVVEQPSPIIIHQTKKVEVTKQVVYVPVPAPAPEPAPVEEAAESEETVAEEPVVKETVEEEVVAVEETAPVEVDESENAMRYNRSFRARLIQSDDEVKEWYGNIKNAILTYDRVSSRISWKYESFSYRRSAVAKLFIKGKTLYLYLPLNAADYADTKYKLEDVSKVAQFADTPALFKLKSERRVKYAQELIDEICVKLGSKKTEREPVDYYEPYNSDVALIKKGLVKRVIEDANKSFIGASGFSKEQDEDTVFDDKK